MAPMRLNKELKDLIASPIEGCTVSVSDDNILNWTITVGGPADSPYEGGKFVVSLAFPDAYPFNPPKGVFKTKIFHPSVASSGSFCLDMLNKDKWSPAKNSRQIVLGLVGMLAHPDPEQPLDAEIGRLLQTDVDKFNETAKEWTQKYAV